MKKKKLDLPPPVPLTHCFNGDGRPLAPTSSLLCIECQAAFDARFVAAWIRDHPKSTSEAIPREAKTTRGGLVK